MDTTSIHAVLVSQMTAALTTLQKAVDACPDELWTLERPRTVAFWRVVYHTLWYTDMYLSPSLETFQPWPKNTEDYQYLGPVFWEGNRQPRIGRPTTRGEMAEFFDHLRRHIPVGIAAAPLADPSGFEWLPMSRFELHLYNLRHAQHHAAQLSARVREHAGTQIPWVVAGER